MHFTLRHHVQDFLMHCRQKGHSQDTMAAYQQSLDKLLKHMDELGIGTRQHMRAYATHLSEVLSPGAAHARLRPIKTFFLWLEADEVLEKSPMRRVLVLPLLSLSIKATASGDL